MGHPVMSEPRPAFYALPIGGWRDIVTLLHLPYTLLHLSFVALGASLAAEVVWERLGATLLAFFLAVGVAAHFLDELQGRPLRTTLSTTFLKAGAAIALVGACAIGVAGAVVVSPWLLVFVAVGALGVLAYNLELFNGLVHGDVQFGILWGAFPFVTANWAMDESFDAATVLGAGACFALSMVQRSLSNPVRRIRRDAKLVRGQVVTHDGSTVAIDRNWVLAGPERALKYLVVGVPLIAAALLVARAI